MNNLKDLIGKTIVCVQQMKLKDYDDEGFLHLEFSDGSHRVIEGGYDGYTGESEDEYKTIIGIASNERELELEPLQIKGE